MVRVCVGGIEGWERSGGTGEAGAEARTRSHSLIDICSVEFDLLLSLCCSGV